MIRYEDYKYLIIKIAFYFIKRYNINISDSRKQEYTNEILSKSKEIFYRCKRDWEPKRGIKFSTYLVKNLTKEIYKYILQIQEIEKKYPIEYNEKIFLNIPHKTNGKWTVNKLAYINWEYNLKELMFRLAIKGLSEEAIRIVNLVLNPSPKLMNFLSQRYDKTYQYKLNKVILRDFIRENFHWKHKNIKYTFEEIEELLRI